MSTAIATGEAASDAAPTDSPTAPALKRVHTCASLTALGVGGIVGAGIFIRVGGAAGIAGPAIILSFLVAAVACITTALCYAELASRFPTAGSVYAYARAAYGTLPGWLLGWDLVLCYALSAASVASGWSQYLQSLAGGNLALPAALKSVPITFGAQGVAASGAWLDLPALGIGLLLTAVAIRGVKDSMRLNAIVLTVKSAVLLLVVGVGAFLVDPANWQPFAAEGWGFRTSPPGQPPHGMLAAATMVFYAYLGFESVAAHVEEAHNPRRDGARAMVFSAVIATGIYVAISAVLTGMVPYREISGNAPLSEAFQRAGQPWVATLITLGALAAITNVLLVIIMTLSRIVMAMGRDGLLPPRFFGAIHSRFHTPAGATLVVGLVSSAFGALVPLDTLAEVLTMGLLILFGAVAIAVLRMRRLQSHVQPVFQAPLGPLVPIVALAVCGVLAVPVVHTLPWLALWALLGLLIYLGYGRKSKVSVGPAG